MKPLAANSPTPRYGDITSMAKGYTKARAFETVAKSLREFGYPDASAAMVKDCWEAMQSGKGDEDMPHGIVGRFAFNQLDEAREQITQFPD